jgi:hypothetical protein
MAEFLLRATALDAALLRRAYGLDGREGLPVRPGRVVVDAHVASSNRGSAVLTAARRAGVPLLIDPRTFYLQGTQHPDDSWALLPYGRPEKLYPNDIDRFGQEELVAQVVDYQVAHGATAIIPPYIHLDRLNSEWIDVQGGLWRSTRRYMDRNNFPLSVTAVLAIGWRVVHPTQGWAALAPALAALSDLGPREVALAATKVDHGVRPQDRVMDLVLMIERLSHHYPVIAWQQGHLGELAVAAGARGYECGIGWREGCDLGTSAANAHRKPQPPGPRAGRPVFIPQLSRSIPKKSLEAIREHRDLWMRIVCTDADCCPPGGTAMLGDARSHAIVQRVKSLEQLARIDRAIWRWQHLADAADNGIDLAGRISRRGLVTSQITQVSSSTLTAISAVSHTRRLDTRSRRIA